MTSGKPTKEQQDIIDAGEVRRRKVISYYEEIKKLHSVYRAFSCKELAHHVLDMGYGRELEQDVEQTRLDNVAELLDTIAGLEEEWRLFYVAVTRAKKELYLSHYNYKTENFSANPSCFLSDIDSTLTEYVGVDRITRSYEIDFEKLNGTRNIVFRIKMERA